MSNAVGLAVIGKWETHHVTFLCQYSAFKNTISQTLNPYSIIVVSGQEVLLGLLSQFKAAFFRVKHMLIRFVKIVLDVAGKWLIITLQTMITFMLMVISE